MCVPSLSAFFLLSSSSSPVLILMLQVADIKIDIHLRRLTPSSRFGNGTSQRRRRRSALGTRTRRTRNRSSKATLQQLQHQAPTHLHLQNHLLQPRQTVALSSRRSQTRTMSRGRRVDWLLRREHCLRRWSLHNGHGEGVLRVDEGDLPGARGFLGCSGAAGLHGLVACSRLSFFVAIACHLVLSCWISLLPLYFFLL